MELFNIMKKPLIFMYLKLYEIYKKLTTIE